MKPKNKQFWFNVARAARIILGLIFIISGFTKAVDPIGTAYKFSDYLTLVFEVPQLKFLSFFFAVSLITIEFTVGVMLLFNFMIDIAIWVAVGLLLFFTPITYFLATHDLLYNCGCFGDAIKLSNWETFYKNLIFLALTIPVIIYRKEFKSLVKLRKKQLSWTLTTALLIVIFQFYNYSFLPVFDYRPYKVGTNIIKSMQVPEDAPKNEYKTYLVYKNKNTGEVKEFTEENYPWDDPNWEWVDTKVELIKKGYTPPIDNFNIVTLQGKDITDSILRIKEPVLIIVAYDLRKTHLKPFVKVLNFSREFTEKYYPRAFCLTASPVQYIDSIKQLTGAYDLEFCHTDETTLKTMVRANPGIIILRDGIIIDKRHYNNLPNLKHKDYSSKQIKERKLKYNVK